MALQFDVATGTLAALVNKQTGETYRVSDDEFYIDAIEFQAGLADMAFRSVERTKHRVKACYEHELLTVEVEYWLEPGQHFVQKRLAITSREPYRLKRLVVSRPEFSAPRLRMVPYRYQKNVTYFGRTPRGGFFTGVELPFDDSSLDGQRVTLAYRPSLKVAARERIDSIDLNPVLVRPEGEGVVAVDALIVPRRPE